MKPNMTVAEFDRWTKSEAFSDYVRRHPDRDVKAVVERTRRVLKGTASEEEERKLESFLDRMTEVDAGDPVNGSGPTAVSDRTASLRNWGYDPTGLYS